jgi:2-polyprenyl-3-methyl-5-hydroxy-6-metoxy-1,4-benzoquinol methylase
VISVNLSSSNDIYFSGSRPEVAAMVPRGATSVLDVGCGFGGLATLLRSQDIKKIYGIEINPSASEHLEKIYDQHWIGSVESINLPQELNSFDCIIFADVLEHLVDPWETLKKYAKYLSPGGVIVASIPNARNLGLIYRLLFRGRWTYGESGILDKTHLRFFTRKEIEILFIQAGLKIEMIDVNRDDYSLSRRLLTGIPRFFVPDLEVCQFLIRAHK